LALIRGLRGAYAPWIHCPSNVEVGGTSVLPLSIWAGLEPEFGIAPEAGPCPFVFSRVVKKLFYHFVNDICRG